MVKKLYYIYVSGELEPYKVIAFNIRDAILIIKGKLIDLGYNSEIKRVEWYNDHTLCTEAYNNITVKVDFDEVV